MTKLIISIIISFAIILGLGIFETVAIERRFEELNSALVALIPLAKEEKIKLADFEPTYKQWKEVRNFSELFLTHADIIEVNIRMNECKSSIENSDYKIAHSQLTVLMELTEYIPRNVTPALRNII